MANLRGQVARNSPYQGLSPYREADSAFFFGRERETTTIASNMLASNLTVLYGPSGVGKSSVLYAGVVPYLRSQSRSTAQRQQDGGAYVITFNSWRDEGVEALKTAISAEIGVGLSRSLGRSFPSGLDAWLRETNSELFIIFDQFEEYFVYATTPAVIDEFGHELSRLLDSGESRISLLISIREEVLAKLDCFKGRIPYVFGNSLRIEQLTRHAAELAIRRPIERLNRLLHENGEAVTIEDALVNEVVNAIRAGRLVIGDAGRGGVSSVHDSIEAPYLQLVMSRIWDEEMTQDSTVLRLRTLNALGGAEAIVKNHLDQVMSALSVDEQRVAASIFHYLVTPSRTKIAHNVSDLASYGGISKTELEPLLERLSSGDRRVLAPISPAPGYADETRYEIFHDVLAPAVLDWRSRFLQHQKSARIEREVAAQRTLLAALDEIGAATVRAVADNSELDAILTDVTDNLGFDYATLGIVDEYRQTVELVRARNVSQASMRRSEFPLGSSDILAEVVRSGRTQVVDGWDSRLNAEIFERFEHGRLARIFAPIIDRGAVVGVLQAGCDRKRRDDLLNTSNIDRVSRIAREKGALVSRARFYKPLELIAQKAIEFLGADAASLHVFRDGRLFLQAGAGRASTEFLRRFHPRPEGIGQHALAEGGPRFLDDPVQIANELPALYEEGVRALVVFPISGVTGIQGLLYVSFWSPHRFTTEEAELGRIFVGQMEVIIQNVLMLQSLTREADRAWELSTLQNVLQALATNPNIDHVLAEVVRNVLLMMEADVVVVHEYAADKNRFVGTPIVVGEYRASAPAIGFESLLPMLREGKSLFITDASDDATYSHDKLGWFLKAEGIVSFAITSLAASGALVGCMLIGYRARSTFAREQMRVLSVLAASAAIAIQSRRLNDQIERQLVRQQNQAMALIENLIVSGTDRENVFELVLRRAIEITGAYAGDVLLYDVRNRLLRRTAWIGAGPFSGQDSPISIEDGVRGHVAELDQPMLIMDTLDTPFTYERLSRETRSILAVPFSGEGRVLGVIALEHLDAGAFSPADVELVQALSAQAVAAIRIGELRTGIRQQTFLVEVLAQIWQAVYYGPTNRDSALRVILTGVTAGQGLGFNTAMLFLLDELDQTLVGKMAIGARTLEEAQEIWARLHQNDTSFKELLSQTGGGLNGTSSIHIEDVVLALGDNESGVARCILAQRPVIIPEESPDIIRGALNRIGVDYTHCAFGCAPIIGVHRQPMGVLVVDNRFTGEPMPGRGLEVLEMFAALAAFVLARESANET